MSVGAAGGAARPRGDAGGDRCGAGPGGVPPPEAGVRVYGRDGAAVVARTGTAAARDALACAGRGPVPGRALVTRPGAGPGGIPAHGARVAEGGLASRPPGRGPPWRPVGGVGRRERTGPVASVEGVPTNVDPSRSVGRTEDTGATTRMIASVPPWTRGAGPTSHTTCSLEGIVPGSSRTGSAGSWTWSSGKIGV